MKAHLMYKDADFDPRGKLPSNEPALTQDLALDTLFGAMALGDKFLFDVARRAILLGTTDLDTILYRQSVLRDCMKNGAIVRDLHRIAIEAIESEKKSYWSYFSRHPGGILHRAVDVLQLLVDALRQLRALADDHAAGFESAGFSRFFTMLRDELGDEYFAFIEGHLETLKFRDGVIISARLGNGNKGRDYVLHKTPHGKWRWFKRIFSPKLPGYTFRLHPRDEGGARALGELTDRGVNLVANALAQSTDHILSFFQMLRSELAFYVGCLNLSERLDAIGKPLCLPVPVAAGERKHSFSGLYDVCLSLRAREPVVGNDVTADDKNIVIITGANQGGKSTFLRSIGLAQLMMQAGMFVASDSLCCEVRGRLFTHYKREEDTNMESGKLDEELSRMSDIVDNINSSSMILFNESFAATNEREGSEIARQITTALIEKGVKVFFVTHLYDFAHAIYERKMDDALFLRAERQADGARTYRLTEGKPLETSYGKDLYDAVFAAEPPQIVKHSESIPACHI
jgi:DNA mismatch repair ATPase MutS